jgi:spore coat protein U-like protein
MNRTYRKPLFGLASWLSILATPVAPGTAWAAVDTGNLGVSIVIQDECLITAINDLNFGTHGVIDAPIPGSTTIDVHCTDTTPFEIGLDAGGGTGATVAVRLLGDTVTYSLYTDSGHTAVWGDITPDTVTGTGDGTAQTFTVYGLVPLQTTPAPATYNDTVTVTVTY